MAIGAYRGELAALAAALLWAIAASIFARLGAKVSPLVLNLVKGLVAIALLLLTLVLLGRPFPPVAARPIAFLLLSGVLGIGLGDTFYFRALALIGARRSLLVESLAPPLSALLALAWLGERLSWANGLGIGLTLAGVSWVVSERLPATPGNRFSLGQLRLQPPQASPPLIGIGYGLLAALGQASGAVLSRAALAETAMDPLWSTLLRLVAGVGLLLGWMLWRGWALGLNPNLGLAPANRQRLISVEPPGRSPLTLRLVATIALTAFFSTYLAIWLQQTALKYAETGVAQALTSTSPLFILPIVWALGEHISARTLTGVLLSLLGIFLLFQ